jgi:HSP20 family molecular chaperone IbpA
MATTTHGGLLATLTWNLQPLLNSPIRIEESANGCAFVVRAEVPGVEPRDISVMVADGELTIEVDRPERHPDCRLSEFRYGRLTRTVRLPRLARPDQVTAVCGAGILEITVGLDAPSPVGRTVRVVAGDDVMPPEAVVPTVHRASRGRGPGASTGGRRPTRARR